MSQEMENKANWQTKFLIMGTLLGAVFGLASAYLFVRTATEKYGEDQPQINTGDALKLGISVFGLARGIAALGDKK